MRDFTLEYYNQNASSFTADTLSANMSDVRTRFLDLLPLHPSVLDFGCGSGRDTKAFLDTGCKVNAMDGSAELCKAASRYTGIEVKCRLFNELDEVEAYDGIWACASILHVSSSELPDVIQRMVRALKLHGIFYASFKYGTFEGTRNGRYFTDMTEEKFENLLHDIHDCKVREQWISFDVRPGRQNEKWLNVLAEKI